MNKPICWRPSDKVVFYLQRLKYLDRRGRVFAGKDMSKYLDEAVIRTVEGVNFPALETPSPKELMAEWRARQISIRKKQVEQLAKEIFILSSEVAVPEVMSDSAITELAEIQVQVIVP